MTTYGTKWSEHRFYKKDPLSEIEPALLNSKDITRYVEEGCLLEQDSFCAERLKPASYEMRLLGTLYYWELGNDRLERRSQKIVVGTDVELRKNSISYLWIQEPLRLPEYIAARFNLRIGAVHKGILLGTGPLVDPGFGGRILIPLHNLTDNTYHLEGGEGIIWVEFTKVSKNSYWESGQGKRPEGLVEFPSIKAMDDPDIYLAKARAMKGVQSAFKGALEDAKAVAKHADRAATVATESAAEARRRAAKIEKRSMRIGIVGLIGVLVGIVSLVFSAMNITGRVADKVYDHGERIRELEMVLERLEVDSNASGGVEGAGVPGSSDLGVEEAVPLQEGLESERENPIANGRGVAPEGRESRVPRVR